MGNPKPFIRGALYIVLVLAAACSGTTDSGNPAAPSTTSIPSAPGTASISGTLASSTTASSVRATAVGLTITVTGTNISTTVSPGGTFVLTGVPTGTVTLVLTGSGVNGRADILDVKDQETIRIVVTVRGSQANVEVTDRQKPQNGTELEGLIGSIDAAARMLVVNGRTVSVPASATIRHGNSSLAFTDLKVGQRVHVKGTVSGATIVATEVKLQDANDDAGSDVEGSVSGLTGSCPNLVFTVKGTKVTTSSSTQFEGACAGVTNGATVEVKGPRMADGSIAASRVEIDHEDH